MVKKKKLDKIPQRVVGVIIIIIITIIFGLSVYNLSNLVVGNLSLTLWWVSLVFFGLIGYVKFMHWLTTKYVEVILK